MLLKRRDQGGISSGAKLDPVATWRLLHESEIKRELTDDGNVCPRKVGGRKPQPERTKIGSNANPPRELFKSNERPGCVDGQLPGEPNASSDEGETCRLIWLRYVQAGHSTLARDDDSYQDGPHEKEHRDHR